MTAPLKEIGVCLSKLRALLRETKKDQARISSLLDSLTASLDSIWTDCANFLPKNNVNSDSASTSDSPSTATATATATANHTIDDTTTKPVEPAVQPNGISSEVISLLASGKILSIAAEAVSSLSLSPSAEEDNGEKWWIADGTKYARWLARGIIHMITTTKGMEASLARLCARSFSLGYTDDIMYELTNGLALNATNQEGLEQYQKLVRCLQRFEQRYFIQSLLRILARRYSLDAQPKITSVSHNSTSSWKSMAEMRLDRSIRGAAALLESLVENVPYVSKILVEWLTKTPLEFNIIRAVMTVLHIDDVENVIRRNWLQFGDTLYIRHTSIIQQEALTQTLLLAVGYLHRSDPSEVGTLIRSGTNSGAVSERLNAPSPRARFLGMVVGQAASALLDKANSRLKFDVDEMKTEEARWYLELVNIKDEVGSIQDLEQQAPTPFARSLPHLSRTTPEAAKTSQTVSTKPKIIEVIDEPDDDDLIPHEKPDSDPEDEDEDPTLVDRHKPKAPVYIRDLIAWLQDTEKYERHILALNTASNLIRRKADFGTELKDRSEELAGVLVSLQELSDMSEWHDVRLQAMVSILVAQPKIIGPWYARAFFSGDYSLSQRGSILTALGLGARELAGFGENAGKEKQFPTQTLPAHLHKLYADSTEINAIAHRMEQSVLKPTKDTTKQRKKILRNDLISIVAESFFFPLTGYWQAQSRMSGARHISTSPYLLPLFLKTLAIIMGAAGRAVVTLRQMSFEFWQLLLAVRSQAVGDATVMEAVLFSLLTVLSLNEDKHYLATECNRELLETQEWVSSVFDKLSNADKEGERSKVLAAGILVAIQEVGEKQREAFLGRAALTF